MRDPIPSHDPRQLEPMQAAFTDFDDYWTPFVGDTGSAPTYCASLSPDALADTRVATLLQQGSWPCSQLVIEVTEHVSVTDYASLVDTVAALRQLGIRIAVDQ